MRVRKMTALILAGAMTASMGTFAFADEAKELPTIDSIKLGEDYTDLTASIKFLHCRTDREEDGSMAEMIAKFNEKFPNIEVKTEGVTDYAEDALLRLSQGNWGDVMWIPAVDKKDLGSYFMPLG